MVSKWKFKNYVLNVHHTFTWGNPCKVKPYILLLTCHPCNIYGSKTCSHGCIVVLVYCHETNPHQAVWNPHSSLEQDKESLQMLCMCPFLEHNHYALTIQIQLVDTAYSAQKTECQTLCLFYVLNGFCGWLEQQNRLWSAVAEMWEESLFTWHKATTQIFDFHIKHYHDVWFWEWTLIMIWETVLFHWQA